MNPRLLLLALCQGLFLTNNVGLVAINGLVGLMLAPHPMLATLPVMGNVVGGAAFTMLVARHQRAYGRTRTFQLGLLVGIASTALCGYAAIIGDFWLLVTGTVLNGYYIANASLYRFAATELVPPANKERAISWVLAGGILGAVAGPNLASATKYLLPATFAGAYFSLAGVALLALLIMSGIAFPPLAQPDVRHPGRTLGQIMRQPLFIGAVGIAALAYGMMTLLMAATPIAMSQCSFPFPKTALVLEAHVLGMFVPSFVTGSLIKRFGALPIIGVGIVLYVACIGLAVSGTSMTQFVLALLTLGIGWNLLYLGGTTLFTEAYRPEEKTTAQGAMDFCVYTIMSLTAFASGALITTRGWQQLALITAIPTVIMAGLLWWLWRMDTRPGRPIASR